MTRRPSCWGNYKGRNGDLTREPVGACRSCQPWRKCQTETRDAFILAFKKKIEDGEKPPCWMHFPDGQWVCPMCPLSRNNQCQYSTANREYIEERQARMDQGMVEEKRLRRRLRAKIAAKWGNQGEPC